MRTAAEESGLQEYKFSSTKKKAKVEDRPKAKVKEKASSATCAEGMGIPHGRASAKDGLMTSRPNEKTPMKKAAGLMWSAILV